MEDFGKLLLRVSLGAFMLFHGVSKITKGISGITEKIVAKGLPEYVAYGVYVGELVVPVLLLVGFATRPAAFIFAVNMAVAVWLVHTGDLLSLGKGGAYALELQGLYFFGALAVMCLGAGRFSASKGQGKLQ